MRNLKLVFSSICAGMALWMLTVLGWFVFALATTPRQGGVRKEFLGGAMYMDTTSVLDGGSLGLTFGVTNGPTTYGLMGCCIVVSFVVLLVASIVKQKKQVQPVAAQ
ncbi:hypothetical protein D2E26_0242 [Bifidobacterium dolichotidis]|uniref:Uncharacterized protein n=1 Tax=Bifidobacterium dolichotidis TaxID=2306976 RepID=A0A430FS45_9BIFI|nr:hypothetical protein [Bifidobacterium dolichotidis]RSX55679.1 hypothetical protein D2E26_0242 [Bifidobacterium dolichotidis]